MLCKFHWDRTINKKNTPEKGSVSLNSHEPNQRYDILLNYDSFHIHSCSKEHEWHILLKHEI